MSTIIFVVGGEEFTCPDIVMTPELEELLVTHFTQKEMGWRQWPQRKRKNDDNTNETVNAKKRGFPGRAFPLNVLPDKQLHDFLLEHQEVEEEIDFHDQSNLSPEVMVVYSTPNHERVLKTVVIGDIDDEL